MSKSGDYIKHEGFIKDISDGVATIEFISLSACAQCHAKVACGASDSQLKVVEVQLDSDSDYKIGDKVNVVLKSSLGMKAVVIAYVIPLIIFMILLLSLHSVFESDLVVGAISLGAIGLCFFITYLFRGKLNKEYKFTIEKI